MSFMHENVVNLYIFYKLDTWSKDLNIDFRLGNCLFGAAKLTKYADLDKYNYIGNDIGFDTCLQFLWSDGGWGKSLSFLVLIKAFLRRLVIEKGILVLGKCSTQGLNDPIIKSEAKYHYFYTKQ